MIEVFTEDHAFLSNFYPCRVIHEGMEYPSAEHAYQASKTADLVLRGKIAKAPTAAKARAMGRKVKLREGFEGDKVRTMEVIVYKKFVQNRNLAKLLFDTKDEFLVEGNWWGDRFWGVCEGRGRNMLGHILMEVREQLK